MAGTFFAAGVNIMFPPRNVAFPSLPAPFAPPPVPDPVIRRIRDQAQRTGAAVAWAQWSTLATIAVPAGPRVRSMVDPEALLLLSLALGDRRLAAVVTGWVRAASPLLSVQRTLALAEAFPPGVREGIGPVARVAADAGDRRWRPHAADPAPEEGPPRRKAAGAPRLAEAPALVLRLRAGFGGGTRADLLAFLLALRGAEASVSLMAGATGFSAGAVRAVVEEMVLGGFAKRVEGSSPAAYCADHRGWAGVLGLRAASSARGPEVPPWRYWSLVFAFLADVLAWADEAEAEAWSAYVASSRARDLVADHARALRVARLRLPDPRAPGGAAFLEDLERGMAHVHDWCLEHL